MNVLETMRMVLEENLEGHKRKATNFYRYSESLRGAAEFAKAIAVKHNDSSLVTVADHVLVWVEERQDALEEESRLESERIWQRDEARYNVRKATARAVNEFVGMEVVDSRWDSLVEEYQRAFPSFQIRSSVADRLHPKRHSALIRTHLCQFIEAQKLGREPSISEIQALHPQALVAHWEETLKYLVRALPGFDFESAWSRADNPSDPNENPGVPEVS